MALSVYIGDFGLAIHENKKEYTNKFAGTTIYKPLRCNGAMSSTYQHDYYSFAAIIAYYIHDELFYKISNLDKNDKPSLISTFDSYFKHTTNEIEKNIRCLLRTVSHSLPTLKECFNNLIIQLGMTNSLVKKNKACQNTTNQSIPQETSTYES